jgi:putative acetyltransferase
MRAAIRAAPGPYRAAERAAWASLPALYHRWAMTAGGEVYVVAERGGRIVGYGAVLSKGLGAASAPGRGWELTAVFVAPASAGRGLGTALAALLLARARRAGVAAVVVDAAAGAVPFYARLGFAPGRALRVPLPGGVTLPSRRMRLALR